MTRPTVILFEVAPEALDLVGLTTPEGRARRRLVVGMGPGVIPAVERVVLDRAGAEVWQVVPAAEGGPSVAYVLERALLTRTGNARETIALGELDRGRS